RVVARRRWEGDGELRPGAGRVLREYLLDRLPRGSRERWMLLDEARAKIGKRSRLGSLRREDVGERVRRSRGALVRRVEAKPKGELPKEGLVEREQERLPLVGFSEMF